MMFSNFDVTAASILTAVLLLFNNFRTISTQQVDCSHYPCFNGGTCVDGFSADMCTCPPGFVLPFCTTSCQSSSAAFQCQNGGTCSNDVCTCPAGLAGPTCESAIAAYLSPQTISVTEGHVGQTTVDVQVCRQPSTQEITLQVFTAPLTANEDSDFEGIPSNTRQDVTLMVGQACTPVSVTIKSDQVIELDESFSLFLSVPSALSSIHGVLGHTQTIITITNDDPGLCCPFGTTAIADRCFAVIEATKVTFTDAVQTCADLGGVLARVNPPSEVNQFLVDYFNSNENIPHIWIGLTRMENPDADTYNWLSDNSSLIPNEAFWSNGQPTGAVGFNCVLAVSTAGVVGEWFLANCRTMSYPLCQFEMTVDCVDDPCIPEPCDSTGPGDITCSSPGFGVVECSCPPGFVSGGDFGPCNVDICEGVTCIEGTGFIFCNANGMCECRDTGFSLETTSANGPCIETTEEPIKTGTNELQTTIPSDTDCSDVYNAGNTQDGVYTILPSGWPGLPFNVTCKMDNGGGWTVFQRRTDNSTSFYQNWTAYKEGFGGNNNFWLGNEKLNYLTNQKDYKLRLDITTSDGSTLNAEYTEFQIESESANYSMNKLGSRISTSGGVAGVWLYTSKYKPFSTYDRDNDACSKFNCAEKHRSGWWHSNDGCSTCYTGSYCSLFTSTAECKSLCTGDNLNGDYNGGNAETIFSGNDNCNIQFVEMKIRPSS